MVYHKFICLFIYIGKGDIDPIDLKEFIKAHPYLRFLGLVITDACYDDSLINPANEDYRPELVVSCNYNYSSILSNKSYFSETRILCLPKHTLVIRDKYN